MKNKFIIGISVLISLVVLAFVTKEKKRVTACLKKTN